MTQFLNFHTHNFLPNSEEKSIYNLLIPDIGRFDEVKRQWLSVGIHPWYADEQHWQQQLAVIEKLAVDTNVIAIGECGLDRGIKLPLTVQLEIFDAQVQLAQRLQKPVIIHCVRAFNELLYWKKKARPTVPLIIHGFNNKPETAQQLMAHGFYFSLGTALLKPDSNAVKALKRLPLTKLFLENDDRDTPVEKIYEAAAATVEMRVDALKTQIWANFVTVFNW